MCEWLRFERSSLGVDAKEDGTSKQLLEHENLNAHHLVKRFGFRIESFYTKLTVLVDPSPSLWPSPI